MVESVEDVKVLDFSSYLDSKVVEENAARIFSTKLELMKEQKEINVPLALAIHAPSRKLEWLWEYALQNGLRY